MIEVIFESNGSDESDGKLEKTGEKGGCLKFDKVNNNKYQKLYKKNVN